MPRKQQSAGNGSREGSDMRSVRSKHASRTNRADLNPGTSGAGRVRVEAKDTTSRGVNRSASRASDTSGYGKSSSLRSQSHTFRKTHQSSNTQRTARSASAAHAGVSSGAQGGRTRAKTSMGQGPASSRRNTRSVGGSHAQRGVSASQGAAHSKNAVTGKGVSSRRTFAQRKSAKPYGDNGKASSAFAPRLQGAHTSYTGGSEAKENQSIVRRIFGAVLGFFGTIFSAIGRVIGGLFGRLYRRSKPLCIGVVALLLLLGIWGVDTWVNSGKIYGNVYVGTVNVGGMTTEQAAKAVSAAYVDTLTEAQLEIYCGTTKPDESCTDATTLKNAGITVPQGSDVPSAFKQFIVTSTQLDATLPLSELSEEAFSVGRGFTGVFSRIFLLFSPNVIEPYANVSESELEKFAMNLDTQCATPRVEYGVVITDGVASVTPGNDGYALDRDELREYVSYALVADPAQREGYATYCPFAAVRITNEIAIATCNKINAAIADGMVLTYQDTTWRTDAAQTGNFVSTEMVRQGTGWTLRPYVVEDAFAAEINDHTRAVVQAASVKVSMEKTDDGSVVVIPGETGTVPLTGAAATLATQELFGEDGSGGSSAAQAADGQAVEVTIPAGDIPSQMSLDVAINVGLVTELSSFTTTYLTGSSREDRINNIHVVSELLNNSICKADGGTWSYNGITGERTAEKGFKAAGSIQGGQHVDSLGGGVCQVATTIFNAVYEGGFRFNKRYAHTLYVASYPAGRDAAVSWDDMDLVWQNDTSSDIVLVMSYTGSSVTATLYGVDPHYTVETTVGEWREGAKYITQYIIEDELDEKTWYTEQSGVDGRSISVSRVVKDASGNVILNNTFDSNYDAENEIIVCGPTGEKAEEARASGNIIKRVET